MKLKTVFFSALVIILPLMAPMAQADSGLSRNFIGEKYPQIDGIWELIDLDIEYMQLSVNAIQYIDLKKYESAQSILDDYYRALNGNNRDMLSFLISYLSPIDYFLIDTTKHMIVDLGDSTYDALSSTFQIENIRDFNNDDFLSFKITNQGFMIANLTITIIDDINIAISFYPDAMTDRDYVVRCFYRRIR